MAKKQANLIRIDHNEPITGRTHCAFLCQLQCALLLALREQGWLSPMQYRQAEETLRKRHGDSAARKQEQP